MIKHIIILSGFVLALGSYETKAAAAEALPSHGSSHTTKTVVLNIIDGEEVDIKSLSLDVLPTEPSEELGWESLCSMYKKLAILYEINGNKDNAAESLHRAINVAEGRDFNLNEKLSALGLDSYPSKEKILAALK